MTQDEKVQYWLNIADSDHTKHLPDDPPYIHNLTRLAEKSGIYELMSDEQKLFLDTMTPMNIEARYPDYKSRIAASLNEGVCEQIMEQTQQMQSWIKSKL